MLLDRLLTVNGSWVKAHCSSLPGGGAGPSRAPRFLWSIFLHTLATCSRLPLWLFFSEKCSSLCLKPEIEGFLAAKSASFRSCVRAKLCGRVRESDPPTAGLKELKISSCVRFASEFRGGFKTCLKTPVIRSGFRDLSQTPASIAKLIQASVSKRVCQ